MTTETQPAARTGQAAHTPTPWHVEEQTNSVGQLLYFRVEHPGRPYRGTVCHVFPAEHIGGITESEARANAEFIVRACNSHAALVAALSVLVAAHDDQLFVCGDDDAEYAGRILREAIAALADAKGGVS